MKKYPTVPDFLADLKEGSREEVDALREIILSVHPGLVEHIKWNSPSYVFKGEDRITFNVRSTGPIRLILHFGATLKEDKNADPVLPDNSGLLEWSSNIRALISFADIGDIRAKEGILKDILRRWLEL
ncbi:MAG TPA: DUF1801 domain-containing protein [Verrucomicrobiae bacterium]|nr:DUF1801 domain-containing protein [Verrucomicrobiae bacterium]